MGYLAPRTISRVVSVSLSVNDEPHPEGSGDRRLPFLARIAGKKGTSETAASRPVYSISNPTDARHPHSNAPGPSDHSPEGAVDSALESRTPGLVPVRRDIRFPEDLPVPPRSY